MSVANYFKLWLGESIVAIVVHYGRTNILHRLQLPNKLQIIKLLKLRAMHVRYKYSMLSPRHALDGPGSDNRRGADSSIRS